MSRKFLILGLLAALILTVYGVLYALTPKTGPNLALEVLTSNRSHQARKRHHWQARADFEATRTEEL